METTKALVKVEQEVLEGEVVEQAVVKKKKEPFDPTELEAWLDKHATNGVDRLLTIDEAAYVLSTTADWLYRNWRKLPFKVVLSPKQIRFSFQKIRAHIENQ
jgi:hypothetical protein